MSTGDLPTHAWCEYHPRTSSAGRVYQTSQSDTIDGLELGVLNVCHVEERIRDFSMGSKTALGGISGYALFLGAAGGYSNLWRTVEANKLKDPSGGRKDNCL